MTEVKAAAKDRVSQRLVELFVAWAWEKHGHRYVEDSLLFGETMALEFLENRLREDWRP